LGLIGATPRISTAAPRNAGRSQVAQNRNTPDPETTITLFLCGDVMTGRAVDQVLPHPGDPRLYEPYVQDARQYVLFGEEPLEHSNDSHQYRSANAATSDAADDARKIEAPGRGSSPNAQHAQQLTTNAAAQDTRNRVAERSQREVLEQRAGDVAADRAADELDDNACQSFHGICPLSLMKH
jgi:hypothetical protein